MTTLAAKTDLFRRYRQTCDTFIETGSGRGEGIRAASGAGFPRIVSFDTSPRYKLLLSRFKPEIKEGRVIIYNRSSTGSRFRTEVLNLEENPALFWLDAWSLIEFENVSTGFPLKTELEVITKFSRIPHTILIGNTGKISKADLTLEDIRWILRKLSPDYTFNHERVLSPVKDVLICTV